METQQFIYAGFWKRFLAYLIDQIIIGLIEIILFVPIVLIFGTGLFSIFCYDNYDEYASVIFSGQYYNDEYSVAAIAMIIFAVIIISILSIVIQWLYYALQESSAKQATLGKSLLNLKVVDLYGNRISFGRATGRFFGKILSGLIFNIGYIMAAFTERKQALHDILANCLVVENDLFKQYQNKDIL